MEKSPPEAAWGSSLSWLIIRLVFIVRGKKKENALLGIVLLFPPSWFSQFKSSQLSNSSFKEGCMNPQWRWACARREGCLTLYLARPSDKGQAHLHLLAGSFLDTKCLDRASGSRREILYTHKLICKKCLQQAGPFRTTTSLKMWQTLPKGVIFIWGAPWQCTFLLPLWGFLYQQSMFSISHEVPFLPGSHLSMCEHLLNGWWFITYNCQGFDIINQERKEVLFSIRWSLYLSR